MRRLGKLWPQLTSFSNLLQAWLNARKGKRRKPAVGIFALQLEQQLFNLQDELREQRWQPGPYRQFTLYERKPRLISAAAFRDRVVHHALINIIEPPLDPRMLPHSYACRRGKGVHAAIGHYQQLARRYPYLLKLDISRYFASIRHDYLMTELQHYLKDPAVLWLLERIIRSSPHGCGRPADPAQGEDLLSPLENPRGIPIGNLTSQFFANLYLNRFDHWLHSQAGGYLRYVDDFFVFADSKARLHALQEQINQRLELLGLIIHPHKQALYRSSERVCVLGYLLSRQRRWLRNDNGYRARRRLQAQADAYARGEISLDDIQPSLQAWIGHAQHAETLGLRRAMFRDIVFQRAAARRE